MKNHDLTLLQAADMLKNRKITSLELTKSAIDRIEYTERDIKAFVTLTFDSALVQAKKVDIAISEGKSLPALAGIPMAIKDSICTKDVKTTCSSRMLENFFPPFNATVSEKLISENQGVMLGKLNMDEFAMGSSTETSAFHKTANPWDLSKVPGGSSGGAAASVSARQIFYSIGSDTGGSIRQPASFCGVVGLKPTYGAISRYGLIAYASSLDQIGPITRNVSDCAKVLNAIVGYDERDSTSVNVKWQDFESQLLNDIKGIRIGIPEEYFGHGLDDEVRHPIDEAIKKFASLGANIERISLPYTDYALSAYYIISCAEASSNLARFDGVKYGYRSPRFKDLDDMYCKTRNEGFGSEVKRRIMLGNFVLSSGYYDAYYLKALKTRTLIKRDFDNAFLKVDVILSPTTPSVAFGFGEKLDDPLKMYLTDVYTVPVNIAGLPAISLPCGFDSNGMPVGMQLIGKHFNESLLLNIAYIYEQNTDHHQKSPSIDCEVTL